VFRRCEDRFVGSDVGPPLTRSQWAVRQMTGALMACAREPNRAGAAGTSGRQRFQLPVLAVNVGVEQAGEQWARARGGLAGATMSPVAQGKSRNE
jgi:hypothetical protein